MDVYVVWMDVSAKIGCIDGRFCNKYTLSDIDSDEVLTGFLPENQGPYALTPNTVEPIPTLGARFPRGGPVRIRSDLDVEVEDLLVGDAPDRGTTLNDSLIWP